MKAAIFIIGSVLNFELSPGKCAFNIFRIFLLLFHLDCHILSFAVHNLRPWSKGYDAGLRSLRSGFDSLRARHT